MHIIEISKILIIFFVVAENQLLPIFLNAALYSAESLIMKVMLFISIVII